MFDKVVVLDLTTNTVLTEVSTPGDPGSVALSSDGSRAYVSQSDVGVVRAIDTATNTVVGTVTGQPGGFGVAVAVAPDHAHLYVADVRDNTVSVVETATNTVAATHPPPGPARWPSPSRPGPPCPRRRTSVSSSTPPRYRT